MGNIPDLGSSHSVGYAGWTSSSKAASMDILILWVDCVNVQGQSLKHALHPILE